MRLFRAPLIAALSLSLSVPMLAAAAPSDTFSEASVPTSDLDLTTPGGVATLQHRLAEASKKVCLEAYPADTMSGDSLRTCRIEVIQHTHAAVQTALRLAAAGRAPSTEQVSSAR